METPAVLTTFVDTCKQAVQGDDARATIHAAMQELFADPAALAAGIPAFTADDIATSPRGFRLGGEALLHQADDLSVMVLGTLPGVIQPPHDHEMVAMIGVFEGCEEQRFWARTDDGIEAWPDASSKPVRSWSWASGQSMQSAHPSTRTHERSTSTSGTSPMWIARCSIRRRSRSTPSNPTGTTHSVAPPSGT